MPANDTKDGLAKAALLKAYEPFAKAIADGLALLSAAEAKVAEAVLSESQAIVALGRKVAEAEAALIAAGATPDQVKDRIMTAIGKARDWTTIRGWVKAATVADGLPKDVAEAFSAQSLMDLARLPESGSKSRKAVATRLAKAGKVQVRTVRQAVKDAVPAGSGNVKPTAKVAEAMARKWADSAKAVNVEDPVALVFWGFAIGLGLRDSDQTREAGRKAIVDLFGPKAIDEAATAKVVAAVRKPRTRKPSAARPKAAKAA